MKEIFLPSFLHSNMVLCAGETGLDNSSLKKLLKEKELLLDQRHEAYISAQY